MDYNFVDPYKKNDDDTQNNENSTQLVPKREKVHISGESKVLLIQIAIALLIVVVVYVISKLDVEWYNDFCTFINDVLEKPIEF